MSSIPVVWVRATNNGPWKTRYLRIGRFLFAVHKSYRRYHCDVTFG